MKIKFYLFLFLISLNTFAIAASVDAVVALKAHNDVRNQLNKGELPGQPIPQPFIGDMVWDKDLADIAQRHTDKCVFEHADQAGNNIYAHSYKYGSIEEGIRLWSEEYKNYDYDSNASINGTLVGHYTQVIWDRTLQVGCAKTSCDMIYYPDGKKIWPGDLYACQYAQPGNYIGQKPYKRQIINSTIAQYTSINQNVHIPLIRVGDSYFRAKMVQTANSPPSFELQVFAQVSEANFDVSEPNTIASLTANKLVLPQLQTDNGSIYEVTLTTSNGSTFKLINLRPK